MLKKKKTTASGKLVLVKSVRRHWTSGGCPLSADRSGTETAQPQNEILCSKGLGGRCPGQAMICWCWTYLCQMGLALNFAKEFDLHQRCQLFF